MTKFHPGSPRVAMNDEIDRASEARPLPATDRRTGKVAIAGRIHSDNSRGSVRRNRQHGCLWRDACFGQRKENHQECDDAIGGQIEAHPKMRR